MKNKKKIVLIMIICVAIIVTVLVILLLVKKGDNSIRNSDTPTETQEATQSYNRTISEKVFFTVDKRIKNYMLGLKSKNNEMVLSYLKEEYVQNNKINKDNVFDNIKTFNNYDSYITIDMYEMRIDAFTAYYVKGKIDGEYIYFEIGLDEKNKTFDINQITEDKYQEEIEKNIEIEKIKSRTIEGKDYNYYNYEELEGQDELIARRYYAEYIRMMLVDSQEAYNFLDTEYKKSKFETYEKFRDYINNKKENLQIAYRLETSDGTDFENFKEYYNYKHNNDKLIVKSYSVEKYENYTQYICVDGHDNYFVFNVKYPGEYTAFLDIYTVKPANLMEKYNKMSDREKFSTNCNFFIQMINSKDYESAYKVLNDSFKQNNFNNIESFIQYVNENFYEYNTISTSFEIEKSNGYYSSEFTISDGNNEKKINVVMQLKENSEYTMSFSM